MATKATLSDIPNGFCSGYLCSSEITSRCRQQGIKYAIEDYVTTVGIVKSADDSIEISAKCYRSQRKSEKPHQIVIVTEKDGTVRESCCSCTAG